MHPGLKPMRIVLALALFGAFVLGGAQLARAWDGTSITITNDTGNGVTVRFYVPAVGEWGSRFIMPHGTSTWSSPRELKSTETTATLSADIKKTGYPAESEQTVCRASMRVKLANDRKNAAKVTFTEHTLRCAWTPSGSTKETN